MPHFGEMGIFEHYKILRPLGKGAMGEVYLAEDTVLSREVAIKFLRLRSGGENEILAKRFLNEAKTLASLNHPNIVSVYSFGEREDISYIVMEYVEGDTLASLIAKKVFTISEAVSILKRVCEGVASTHSKGVLHRDIKPSNIIVTPSGQVKLVDFGISKSVMVDAGDLTMSDHFIGTVSYMAPEITKGFPPSPRSDIFALGVVFYEMVVGKNPFTSANSFQTIEKIKTEELEWPVSVAERMPSDLRNTFSKMTTKNPDVRYQSVQQLLDDLKQTSVKEPQSMALDIEFDIVEASNKAQLRKTLLAQGFLEEEMEVIITTAITMEKSNRADSPPDDQTVDMSLSPQINVSKTTLNRAISEFVALRMGAKKKKQAAEYKKSINTIDLSHTAPKRSGLLSKFLAVSILLGGCAMIVYNTSLKEKLAQQLKSQFLTELGIDKLGWSKIAKNALSNDASQEEEADDQRQVATQEVGVPIETVAEGMQFNYSIKNMDEDSGRIISEDILSLVIDNVAGGKVIARSRSRRQKKWYKIEFHRNSLIPPQRYIFGKGKEIRYRVTDGYKSLSPLVVGKAATYQYTRFNTDNSFVESTQNCEVMGRRDFVVKNKNFQTFEIGCQRASGGGPWATRHFYSQDLKYIIRKETYTRRGPRKYVQVQQLVDYKEESP